MLNLRAEPMVSISILPGRQLPILIIISRRARPSAMLWRDCLPGPRAHDFELIPISRVIGPLTIISGACELVDIAIARTRSPMLVYALHAAIRIGRCDGSQPAITALMAIFSTVAKP